MRFDDGKVLLVKLFAGNWRLLSLALLLLRDHDLLTAELLDELGDIDTAEPQLFFGPDAEYGFTKPPRNNLAILVFRDRSAVEDFPIGYPMWLRSLGVYLAEHLIECHLAVPEDPLQIDRAADEMALYFSALFAAAAIAEGRRRGYMHQNPRRSVG
jgi:hypothetical protein